MIIVLARQAVLSQDLKVRLHKERSQIVKEKGFDSIEYFEKLVSNCHEVIEEEQAGLYEVLEKLGISDFVLSESQTAYVGEVESSGFVCNFIELFSFFPYKHAVQKSKAEALPIVQAVVAKALQMMGREDTMRRLENAELCMFVFNALCVDIAHEEH